MNKKELIKSFVITQSNDLVVVKGANGKEATFTYESYDAFIKNAINEALYKLFE